jgi:hypothetical protein
MKVIRPFWLMILALGDLKNKLQKLRLCVFARDPSYQQYYNHNRAIASVNATNAW